MIASNINKVPAHLQAAIAGTVKKKIEKSKEILKNKEYEYENHTTYIFDSEHLESLPTIEVLKMVNEWSNLVFPLEFGYEDVNGEIPLTAAKKLEVTSQKYLMFNNAKSTVLKHIPKRMPFYKFEELMNDICLGDALENIINKYQKDSLKEIRGRIANFICRRMFKSDSYFTLQALKQKSPYTDKQIKTSLQSLVKKEVVLVSERGNYYINPTVFETKSNKLIYEEPPKINWDKWVEENKVYNISARINLNVVS